MLYSHCQHHHLLFRNPHGHVPLSLSSSSSSSCLSHSYFLHRPISTLHLVSAIPPTTSPWLTHIDIDIGAKLNIELDPSTSTTIIQVASSVLLTVAIAVFLFSPIKRRAKRDKDLKSTSMSSAVEKSLNLNGLKATRTRTQTQTRLKKSFKVKNPPKPDQALLGAIIAAVIALLLYNFTTNIEAAFSRQTISDNFSVRQVTITIRTIINDLCYLATFIYGFNSIGLLLYSGQLAMNSFVGAGSNSTTGKETTEQKGLSNSSSVESLTGNKDQLSNTKEDQHTNKPK